jgi:intracellular sulfur oxidation DsrE/DsrF family protein
MQMKHFALGSLAILSALSCIAAFAADPAPVKPMIAGALPYVPIPGAAATPDRSHVYKVIFNVTQGAAQPDQPVAGILFAATDLSALRGQGVPQANTKFALIFHGPGGPALGAVDALLNNQSYRAKFGVDNPNLAMLSALKQAGAEILVCGQFLGAMKIDLTTLSSDVTIASEAFLTLIRYQNNGYAVLEF